MIGLFSSQVFHLVLFFHLQFDLQRNLVTFIQIKSTIYYACTCLNKLYNTYIQLYVLALLSVLYAKDCLRASQEANLNAAFAFKLLYMSAIIGLLYIAHVMWVRLSIMHNKTSCYMLTMQNTAFIMYVCITGILHLIHLHIIK